MTAALPQVLLVEPQFVLRRTVAAVARDLQLAQVHEAANLGAAERMAALQPYAVVVLAQEAAPDAPAAALDRLAALAQGARGILLLAGPADMPTGGHAVLHKPVKVKDLLQSLGTQAAR